MSYHAYNMPPPMPVDPTNVSGKRVVAWVIDGIIFVVIFTVLLSVMGIGPTTTDVSAEAIKAQTNATVVDADDAAAYCNDWNQSHGGIFTGLCVPNTSEQGTDEGTAMIVEDFNGIYWTFLGLLVVFIIYQGLLGASLGKMAMGLRIVKRDGSLAGIGASAIRTVLWIVDAITCGLPIIGGILILSTTGHRRVGDMAAGTYIVSQSQVGHPVILPGQPGWGTYQQAGPPPSGYPPLGQPGDPAMGPSPTANPWAPPGPASPPSDFPGTPPDPSGPPSDPSSSGGTGDYEADRPIWDDARRAYIQYDSARGAWLEFDDKVQQWKPIST